MKLKVNAMALSPIAVGHCIIAVGTDDQKCRLCDVRTGTTSHSLIGLGSFPCVNK